MEQDLLITQMMHQAVAEWIELAKQIPIKPLPDEYYVFKEPNAQEWFITLIYHDTDILHAAIRNASCYQLHALMWANLPRVEAFQNISTSIFFESANFPPEATEDDMEDFLDAIIQKKNRLKAESGGPQPEHCSCCGHAFASHQMAGFPEEGQEMPTQGWMMCREKNCTCFRTWSMEN